MFDTCQFDADHIFKFPHGFLPHRFNHSGNFRIQLISPIVSQILKTLQGVLRMIAGSFLKEIDFSLMWLLSLPNVQKKQNVPTSIGSCAFY